LRLYFREIKLLKKDYTYNNNDNNNNNVIYTAQIRQGRKCAYDHFILIFYL